jgi:thymidine phosphorylase
MDAPIGRTIGNALEVRESIEILRGGGPTDTRELTIALGAEMLVLAGVARDPDDGRARITTVLADGSALAVFAKVVEAQGGDPRVCDDPGKVLPRAVHRTPLTLAPGRVVAIDAEGLGMAALVLGAGRRMTTDVIAPGAGIVCDTYLGEDITTADADTPRVILHHDYSADDARVADATARVRAAIRIGPPETGPTPRSSRILEVLR